MVHLTAVVVPKEKDNDRNVYPETGIFVTHSPTKICTKNNYNNMFLNYNYTKTLLTICLLLIYFSQQCLATLPATLTVINKEKRSFDVFKPPPAPYECDSIDLRNNCNDFYKLYNCTAITGFLDIVYISANIGCNFSNYQFPNLKEITDFLIINDVRNLTSIKNMFPNLTVIRGQRLLLNYALVVSAVHDLEKLEFKSLIALPRGHAIVGDNHKLCYIEKINWSRLALRPGTNNIFDAKNPICKEKAKCSGCKRDSCWSNDVCQKIENDSVISLAQDTTQCHEQCLGGCYNRSAQGCVVCKSFTDHGICVEECPNNKYASSHYLRCYTREECLKKNLYIHENTCVDFCPSGYHLNNTTRECDSCGEINNCPKICYSSKTYESIIYIHNIMHAEILKGCEILNASVIIYMYEYFDRQELMENLKDVKEIKGYLKIFRSRYITSLNFFQNLEKIHGHTLESKQFALVIYDNDALRELWNVKPGLEIVNGGAFIHGNDKLCNRRIRQFREDIKHDKSLDSVQTSDQEVLCSPAKLNLYVQALNHRTIEFSWPIDQTLAQVEIIYKPVKDKEQLTEKSELDTDVCNRIIWRRELKFPHELKKNVTKYYYTIQNLEPHTRYAMLVKTFNGEDDTQEARSEIKYATTKFDIPKVPQVSLISKTFNTLHIDLSNDDVKPVGGSQVVDFYVLKVYNIPDDRDILDTRDYCDEPVMSFKDSSDEDYDDCCSRRDKDMKDKHFLSQLKQDFSCSLDRNEYCKQDYKDTGEHKLILRKRLEAWENNYTIASLKQFHLYVIQVQACNHAGCSSYNMLSVRTNYSTVADKIYDFFACKMINTNEYRVNFSEPQMPNGYITSYALHFRNHISNDNIHADHNEVVCITRLEHERNNHFYVAHYNHIFNQAGVRVHSLGYNTFIGWVDIGPCVPTKSAGAFSGTWNILILLVLIIIAGTILWICCKRRYWHRIPQLCQYVSLFTGWRYLRPDSFTDDGNSLMDGFETVYFPNRSDEEDRVYFIQ